MSEDSKCYFCGKECDIESGDMQHHDETHYECNYCGKYLILDVVKCQIKDKEEKLKVADALHRRQLKGSGGVALSKKTDMENRDVVYGYPRIAVSDLLDEDN